jgi:hypothetical protein
MWTCNPIKAEPNFKQLNKKSNVSAWEKGCVMSHSRIYQNWEDQKKTQNTFDFVSIDQNAHSPVPV